MRQTRLRFSISALLLALVAVLLGLTASPAIAAASLYENDATVTDPSPIPDATNFVNTGNYEVTFPDLGLYKTHDALNFTNTGYMSAGFAISGTPISEQISGTVIVGEALGFQFDDYSTSNNWDYEAASFDNENTIECVAQCFIWATNISNPGWMFVDNNLGMMQFTGNNIDLSDSVCFIAGGLGTGGISTNSLDDGVGTDTNKDWDPSIALTANSADSSEFNSVLVPKPGFETLDLPDSTSYFFIEAPATNDTTFWGAFVQDLNPSVPYNVFFGSNPVGPGIITVGWSGLYTNIATGAILTNYLYLNDEPIIIYSNGVNTVKVNAGFPNNFAFAGSATPLLSGPATAGFQNVFISGVVTDNYSYVEAQFISTTVPTNGLGGTNVSAIASRVMINAAQELNLNQVQINGENYINLTATNQFDGTGGAPVGAAYSDLALGVTNGNLVVSNVLQSQLPIWSGSLQAWSTRWLTIITNSIITFTNNNVPISTNSFAVTNDYRMELVNSGDIGPTTPSQVQNLTLLGTNSVILSDSMNVFGNLFINAQSLTLTTNGIGVGAYSEEGTLNVENNNILWPAAFPNLHWLTNNGAITLGNLANFGSAAIDYITNSIPTIPGTAPTDLLSGISNTTNGLKGKNVTIGTNVYVFQSKITNTIPNQIKIALTFGGTMSNLIAAINRGPGRGTNYSSNTVANVSVTAGTFANMGFTVTADTIGTLEDSVTNTTTSTNLIWSSLTLTGGTNTIPGMTNIVAEAGPYGAFINGGMISDAGSQIYANYFENNGIINGIANNFSLNCVNAAIGNGEILTYVPLPPYFTNGFSGNITITADSLVISNSVLAAGGGLNFLVTNSFSDAVPPFSTQSPAVTNGNTFFSDGSGSLTGINLPVKPGSGDLLGTTLFVLTPPPNKVVKNIWAGQDFGVSTNGYFNNEAIGQLVLDVTTPGSSMYFTGVATNGATNAIYVDKLELLNYASYANNEGTPNILALNFNTNLVIYYADAVASSSVNGGSLLDVSSLLNNFNHGHLRWVPGYIGYFSSTNIVYPNGSTNTLNAGLVSSGNLDSNGDGIPNGGESDPIFVGSQVNFTQIGNELIWDSIPSSTNTVLHSPDMSTWTIYTNFVSPSVVPPVGGWPITNILFVPPSGFYQVGVSPNNTDVYGQ